MQQFVVPQFITVENKIFGPVTVRQFMILLVAGGLIFIFNRLFQLYLFAVLTFLVGGTALIVAFVKIRGQTFHYFLLNFFAYLRLPNMRIWNKVYTDTELNALRNEYADVVAVKEHLQRRPDRSHIRQLSLQVNTGGYYKAVQDHSSDAGVDHIDIG
jgi:hypothetical protein